MADSRFSVIDELIARTPYRPDSLRIIGIITEFAAQPGDVNVHGSVEGLFIRAFHQVHKALPGQYPSRAFGKGQQEGKLVGGQIQGKTVEGRLMRTGIEHQAAGPDGTFTGPGLPP